MSWPAKAAHSTSRRGRLSSGETPRLAAHRRFDMLSECRLRGMTEGWRDLLPDPATLIPANAWIRQAYTTHLPIAVWVCRPSSADGVLLTPARARASLARTPAATRALSVVSAGRLPQELVLPSSIVARAMFRVRTHARKAALLQSLFRRLGRSQDFVEFTKSALDRPFVPT